VKIKVQKQKQRKTLKIELRVQIKKLEKKNKFLTENGREKKKRGANIGYAIPTLSGAGVGLEIKDSFPV